MVLVLMERRRLSDSNYVKNELKRPSGYHTSGVTDDITKGKKKQLDHYFETP
jgi:hypothetical protein